MAKTTRANGPSIEPVIIRRAELGRVDQPCHGTNLPPSSLSEGKPSESQTQIPQPPAPTMENPSSVPAKEAVSTAPLTAGDGQMETQPPSARRRQARKAAQPAHDTSKKARARVIPTDDFDEF